MAPKPGKPAKAGKAAKAAKAAEAVAAAAAGAPPPADAVRARTGVVGEVLDRVHGVRLCYGEPVREAGRTVIPVARVRAAGGGGWGSGGGETGGGGGGGGSLDALPVGFIEIGPDGTRFEPIADPEAATRTLKAATAALVTVATALAGLRAARGRRLLGRGR